MVLGQANHPVGSGTRSSAMGCRLVALQFQSLSGLMNIHQDHAVIHRRVLYRDLGLVLRKRRRSSKDEKCGAGRENEEDASLHNASFASLTRSRLQINYLARGILKQ